MHSAAERRAPGAEWTEEEEGTREASCHLLKEAEGV